MKTNETRYYDKNELQTRLGITKGKWQYHRWVKRSIPEPKKIIGLTYYWSESQVEAIARAIETPALRDKKILETYHWTPEEEEIMATCLNKQQFAEAVGITLGQLNSYTYRKRGHNIARPAHYLGKRGFYEKSQIEEAKNVIQMQPLAILKKGVVDRHERIDEIEKKLLVLIEIAQVSEHALRQSIKDARTKYNDTIRTLDYDLDKMIRVDLEYEAKKIRQKELLRAREKYRVQMGVIATQRKHLKAEKRKLKGGK